MCGYKREDCCRCLPNALPAWQRWQHRRIEMSGERFGETVRRLREQAGVSLRGLARDAHIDAGHLSRVESGQRPPTRELAIALDNALAAGGTIVAAGAAGPLPSLTAHLWGRSDSEALADLL